jgi:serine/threonine protein kinase
MAFNVNRFQTVDHIGSGGNAAVVRGFVDGHSPRKVALKLLDPRCVNAHDRNRENRNFEHPNLVRIEELLNLNDLGFVRVPDWYSTILNCDPEPFVSHPVASCNPALDSWRQRRNDKSLAEFDVVDFFILVMEYCPTLLSDHIGVSRSMDEVHRVLIEVCAGLTAMHTEGIIHTDLSIENILLATEGVAKIADFGLSERWEEGITKFDRNPDVAAPELMGGEGDPRSDIYSLGLLAFELATGKKMPPYTMMDKDEDVSELGVDRRFVEVCKQAVQFFPDDRFDTVDDFLEALNKTEW